MVQWDNLPRPAHGGRARDVFIAASIVPYGLALGFEILYGTGAKCDG